MKRIHYFLIVVVAALVFLLIALFSGKLSFISYGDGRINFNSGPKNEVDFSGLWSMEFDFESCEKEQFKGLVTYYEISFWHTANGIEGSGFKVGESYYGKKTRYQKRFPVKLFGEIKKNILNLRLFESNLNGEVSGKVSIDLDSNYFVYKGEFIPNGDNCNGEILLKKILNI